ncbi:MAG: proline dehydrogenase family protein, partial [Nitrospinota bacterium]|nr:proline dehydrogenase family protein [Nitrospinota bacterium]
MDNQDLERQTKSIGAQIYNRAKASEPSATEALWWERQLIKWLSSDQEIKSRAMRFIDVFPSLKTHRQIASHIGEYMPLESHRIPGYLRLGQAAVRSAMLTPGAASLATRLVINKVARWFIAGATLEEAAAVMDKLHAQSMSCTMDLLGEATLSDREADLYAQRYVSLINHLSAAARPGWPAVNVSVKLSALSPHFDPGAPEESSRVVRERLRLIFRVAQAHGAWVNLDMENFALRDLTLKVFMELLEEEEFQGYTKAGIVAQAYLKDAEESLDRLLGWVKEKNRNISVRLVKGAYWEQEMVWARQKGWPTPALEVKAHTDAAFERMAGTLLENHAHVVTAVASHNIRSIARAVAIYQSMDIPKDRFEVQMLHGMAGEVRQALAQMGIAVRIYTPFGEFLPGMAYLVRRILENSSNESFLRQSFIEETPMETLLADPAQAGAPARPEAAPSAAVEETGVIFVNEPEPMFHLPKERDQMDQALEAVEKDLGRRYKIIIGGQAIPSAQTFLSVDPGEPETVVGEVCQADGAQAAEAMDSAAEAFQRWGGLPVERRMDILRRAADIIQGRKHELAAWQIIEVGKNRREAMADVNEAIDLIRYYAHCAEKLFKPRKTEDLLGETNILRLVPRGPGVVIAPWNFPLAILAGMTCSALAAGNTVVIKPSSLSPVTAALFTGILLEAGAPDGVVNYLPGPGGALGPALLEHPATSFVCFTGSYETGAWLVRAAGAEAPGSDGFVKVIAEMGGKNAIIVDNTADLDAAVGGVIQSAFGFGGQKCSACSRVIVLDGVYEELAGRVVDAAASLRVRQAWDPSADFGPLIEKAAVEKTAKYVEIGARDAKTLLAPATAPDGGYFAMPAIFGDTPPFSRLARDEIFGPVLCLIRVRSLDEALTVANGAQYALTGGIYSRTPSAIRKVIESLRVGNMYINRGITGAVVRRQPFGGFKRSGLGSAKAGGEDLVRELALPQT